MKYQVEKNVPLQSHVYGKWSFTDDMEIGDSLIVKNRSEVECIRTRFIRHGKTIRSREWINPAMIGTVDDLGLTARSVNCLKGANIGSIHELTLCTEFDLIHMDNLGKKSFREITEAVKSRGLFLKGWDKKINRSMNKSYRIWRMT